MEKNILIIAGEPSGDARAGELLGELKKLLPGTRFWGMGGDLMERQGAELVEHISKLSIVGVWEVLKNLSRIRKQYANLVNNVNERKPSMAILVDYPGFNLRVASLLHRRGIPVVYYVIPQVWAWGLHRIKELKSNVDKAVVLFGFEKKLLEKYGIDAAFAGHPLVDKAADFETTAAERGLPTIALLPGSRKSEILSMFPVMLEAAERILEKKQDARFVVAENSNVEKKLYDSMIARHAGLPLSRVVDDTFGCLGRADFAIVTSGTATLETAVMEKPMIVTYRASALCYYLYRLFRRIRFLGLVNIIAGKEVVPELLQNDATARKLSDKTLEVLNDPALARRIKEDLRRVRDSLGEKGASRRAALEIEGFIREKGI